MARQRKTWRLRTSDTTVVEVSAAPDATRTQIRRRGRWSLVVGILAALAVIATVASATVSTDQQDYSPGSTVTVRGGNDSSGAPGYVQGHTVNVAATNKDTGWTGSCSTTITAADGSWSCAFVLPSDSSLAVGTYSYTATSTDMNGNSISESGTFTDAAAANVSFAAAGLPDGTSVSVPYSGTNNGNQLQSGTATFTTPAASADVGFKPSTSLTFTFPTSAGGCTLDHTSVNSPTTTPAGQSSTTITGTYTCPVANHAPNDPSNLRVSSGSSPNNTGQFTLAWDGASPVDPDSGDTVTYTLQHHSNGGTYSDVATGLTTTSYTFGSGNAEAEGTWSYRVKAVDNHGASSGWVEQINLFKVDKTAPNDPTVSSPTTAAYNDGATDWYKDSVTVSFAANGDPNLSDGSAGSGVASVTSSLTYDSSNVNATTGAFSRTGYATDNAGNQSANGTTVGGKVDWQTPTASFSDCPASPVILGSSGTLHWSATDAAPSSGLATASSGTVPLDAAAVGSHTLSGTAPQDNVGHTGTAASCTYNVVYNWTGFFQPVNNLTDPQPWNSAKAGSAIPVKFNLGGNQGTNIFNAGYPKITQIQCPNSTVVPDPIETYLTTTAGGSTLTYDTTAMQYIYAWKTDKTWSGKCFAFDLGLNDGSSHQFNVQFTK